MLSSLNTAAHYLNHFGRCYLHCCKVLYRLLSSSLHSCPMFGINLSMKEVEEHWLKFSCSGSVLNLKVFFSFYHCFHVECVNYL